MGMVCTVKSKGWSERPNDTAEAGVFVESDGSEEDWFTVFFA